MNRREFFWRTGAVVAAGIAVAAGDPHYMGLPSEPSVFCPPGMFPLISGGWSPDLWKNDSRLVASGDHR